MTKALPQHTERDDIVEHASQLTSLLERRNPKMMIRVLGRHVPQSGGGSGASSGSAGFFPLAADTTSTIRATTAPKASAAPKTTSQSPNTVWVSESGSSPPLKSVRAAVMPA